MVEPIREDLPTIDLGQPRIVSFSVEGGVFDRRHLIRLPSQSENSSTPNILILSGRNGCGKTTVLQMIAGMLELNFDVFRRIPFSKADLELSDGSVLSVRSLENEEFPLEISFQGIVAELYKERAPTEYSKEQRKQVNDLRARAIPLLDRINFELIDIHRSAALKRDENSPEAEIRNRLLAATASAPTRLSSSKDLLAQKIQTFIANAQMNYRKYFAADELDLVPRLVQRFENPTTAPTLKDLRDRLTVVESRVPDLHRFGLQTDDTDLRALHAVLERSELQNDNARVLLGAYIEMQENRQKQRDLIAKRLVEFETIMDEFLVDKVVRIEGRRGLQILTPYNDSIRETELSSGEYHFLYMMVSALLCQRSGSIIAIDEPELSLHTTWQRKLLAALSHCAAGASPVFMFATHSAAIAAEYRAQTYSFSPI